jgi:hypothetical protein
MFDQEKEQFYDCLDSALQIKGKTLTTGVFQIWWDILCPYHFEDIKKAIRQAVTQTSFALDPAKILEQLPDLLGHVTPEIAWTLYTKTEADSGYVTDEIMQAGQSIDPLDKMARMPFLEAYKQIIASAKMNQKPAKWWYSISNTGTSIERKETKIQHTLEAMQCGRLTEARAQNTVRLLSQELGKPLSQYLPGLPEPKPTMTLTDQRQQIGIISKKIEKALQPTSESSHSTEEDTEKARAERVRKLQEELDSYNKAG